MSLFSKKGQTIDAEADVLRSRLQLLEEIIEVGEPRLDRDVVARAQGMAANAAERLGHGTSHTIVALAGATGSGKSSLFNALVGEALAAVSVKRPTTSVGRAAVFGDGAEALLDWMEISQRHRMATAEELDGLVLLDLPDHDSTVAAHREEMDRLVAVTDVFCWVVDPQKYADAALHDGYLQKFAHHGAVTIVALNQIDRLSTDERRECLRHLQQLLREDGLQSVRVIATSATVGDGLPELRREIAAQVSQRRAIVSRLDADLDWIAGDLAGSCGDVDPKPVAKGQRDRMIEAATAASGADLVADAVGNAYRYQASLSVGWPPVRWVRRFRADPLRKIGLRSKDERIPGLDESVTVRRTSLPPMTPVARGALGTAARDLADRSTEGLPEPWVHNVRSIAQAAIDKLPNAIDTAIAGVEPKVQPPRWWTPLAVIQRLLTLCLVVGLGWLAVLFVMKWFQLPDPPTIKLGAVPLPSILTLGCGGIGFLLAVIGRRLAAIGGRRQAEQAKDELRKSVAGAVDRTIIEPVNTELKHCETLAGLSRKLTRS